MRLQRLQRLQRSAARDCSSKLTRSKLRAAHLVTPELDGPSTCEGKADGESQRTRRAMDRVSMGRDGAGVHEGVQSSQTGTSATGHAPEGVDVHSHQGHGADGDGGEGAHFHGLQDQQEDVEKRKKGACV